MPFPPLLLLLLLLLVAAASGAEEAANKVSRPNILFVLVDDLGFGNVGFTADLFSRQQTEQVYEHTLEHELRLQVRRREVLASSSFITSLAREGRVLKRHYVHSTCSPTRSSLQSGRLPVHVQMTLMGPCQLTAGIPVDMTCVAERMQLANYSSHFVGKWDAGMAYKEQLPINRGYNSSLNYFSHGNWMWTEEAWIGSMVNSSSPPLCRLEHGCAKDLWDTDRPAIKLNGTGYEEGLFRDRLLDIIHKSAKTPETPLFLMYHPRVAHYPLQAPRKYQDAFAFIPHRHRRVYTAMIRYLDDVLRDVVHALKRTKRWENTLMIFTSDNGGVVKQPVRCVESKSAHRENAGEDEGLVCFNGEAGGNNFPLRGGKYTNWEGGIRVATFVSGGILPAHVRGRPMEEMMHIADWYTTLQAFAGLNDAESFEDAKAKRAGLPGIDSVNFKSTIMGDFAAALPRTPPRKTILLNSKSLIKGKYKLLLGLQFGANWAGPLYPNISTLASPVYDSIMFCRPVCLFDVEEDPLETVNLAKLLPHVVLDLQQELAQQVKTIWNRPSIVTPDPQCFAAARERWQGFLGPFKEWSSDAARVGRKELPSSTWSWLWGAEDLALS